MLATYPAHRFNDTYTTVDEHSTHSLPPYHATPTPVWAPWSTVALDQQQPIYLDAEALSRIPRQHHQQQQPHPSGLMSESSSLQQPPIQFHPSTPGQFIPDTDTTWSTVEEGVAQLGQAMVQQRGSESDARLKMHQRAHSNSSIASTGPASPFDTNSISNPYIVSSNNNTPGSNMTVDSPGFDAGSPTDHNSKAVPTPSHTPLRQTYLLPEGDYSSTNMRRRCSMAHRRSTSLGDAPSSLTPATTYGEQHSESRSAVTNTTSALDAWIGQGPGEVDSNNNKSIVPKLQRTTTDAIEDELFPPTSLGTISTSPSISPSTHRRTVSENQNLLSPYRTVFNERMYAANQAHLLEARGSSPGTTTLSRERSPFRQGSPYAPSVSSFDTPSPHHHHHSRFGSLSSTGRGGSQVMEVSVPDEVTAPPRATISPRDVQLEFHDVDEDSQMPLFPPMSESNTEQLPVTTSTSFDFSSPPIPSAATTGIHTLLPPLPQQYPFIPHPRLVEAGNNNNNNNNGSFTQQHPSSDSIPEFPAHLTSMETSSNRLSSHDAPLITPTSPTTTTTTTSTSIQEWEWE
ncbi:MAG: hypothetical protein M1823_002157 [Watsoniomyces obsoletus]|nr:MAG: hypothetical protein M1823_002157 [Watsoniomyces obsoletus]